MTAPAHRSGSAWLGLLWTLVRTEFKSRYHGTIGGFLWALAKPFAMFLVLWAVFSFVFHSDLAYRTNLIIGLFLYEFFSEAVKTGVVALYSKGFLLSRARFPAWILILASLSNPALTLGVFLIALLGFRSITAQVLDVASVCLVMGYIAGFVALITGLSLANSVLFLRYRDLNQVWDVVLQAGFFLAPVVYPIEIISEPFRSLLYLWPPTSVIEFTRSVIVDGTVPSTAAHLCFAAGAASVFAFGVLAFRALAPNAAEHL